MIAVSEWIEMLLHSLIPIGMIEQILLQPENTKKILQGNWHSVTIALERLPWFDVKEFEIRAVSFGYATIERQADLLVKIIWPWAWKNGIQYTSEDNHTLSSLRMSFRKREDI